MSVTGEGTRSVDTDTRLYTDNVGDEAYFSFQNTEDRVLCSSVNIRGQQRFFWEKLSIETSLKLYAQEP